MFACTSTGSSARSMVRGSEGSRPPMVSRTALSSLSPNERNLSSSDGRFRPLAAAGRTRSNTRSRASPTLCTRVGAEAGPGSAGAEAGTVRPDLCLSTHTAPAATTQRTR